MFTIELPDKLRVLVEESMRREGFETPEKLLEILIIRHHHWWDDTPISEELEAELLKGLEGEPVEFTPEGWREFKEGLMRKAQLQPDHAKAVGA